MLTQVPPTFEQFVQFIRRETAQRRKPITADTLIEENLGVSGDDGVELLEAVEKEYSISLETIGEILQLQPGESLFTPEGLMIHFPTLLRWLGLSKEPKLIIRKFRVGELYDVVCQLIVARGKGNG